MYSQLITFFAVILLFEFSLLFPRAKQLDGISVMGLTIAAVMIFYIMARGIFARWERRMRSGLVDPQLARFLHGSLVQRLAVSGVGLYALILFAGNWTGFCTSIVGEKDSLLLLLRLLGILPFLLFLLVLWAASYPSIRISVGPDASLGRYVSSQVRLHLTILVPWMGILLLMDLLALLAPAIALKIQEDILLGLAAFLFFLLVLTWIFPVVVVRLWRCPSMPPGRPRERLERFFSDHGFRYADILLWTLLPGGVSTAGILGAFPKTRYILITPALLSTLSDEEVEAVMAHEMGHAQHRHMLFYLIFMGGLLLVFDLYRTAMTFFSDLGLLVLRARGILPASSVGQLETIYTIVSAAILLSSMILMVLYFRFGFGFFSRNFERQSDLHALQIQGEPEHLIRSFEKISGFSRRVRLLPSWHHFSIQERIDFLRACQRQPALVKAHHRKVRGMVAGYVAMMLVFGGLLLSWRTQRWGLGWVLAEQQTLLERLATDSPTDPALWLALGTIALERKQYGEAQRALEKSVELSPRNSEALNNLAWLYATAPEGPYRNPREALRLARMAVALRPNSPHILDTLAESLFINGWPEKALEIEKRAYALAGERKPEYRARIERFQKALREAP